ncbi:MAG: transposase zinc-binding domain-containing protein [Deltaproteobacteria bacterium]|nr:transposase zinc-binding domain-containing protein [Deltaproteobacteria bacterium]
MVFDEGEIARGDRLEEARLVQRKRAVLHPESQVLALTGLLAADDRFACLGGAILVDDAETRKEGVGQREAHEKDICHLSCGLERLVAYSCRGRGLCPSCIAKRSALTAAHLCDGVLPVCPYRQWTLSLPIHVFYSSLTPLVHSNLRGTTHRAYKLFIG